MSRGCHAEGTSGERSSCEAGLAVVSTESRRCAEINEGTEPQIGLDICLMSPYSK